MIKDTLKEIREKTGMNKKEFANYIGVKYTTYNGYETGAREPASDFLILISKMFDVSVDYIVGLTDEAEVLHSYSLKSAEMEHISKFRELDDIGKEIITFLLDKELQRVNELEMARAHSSKSRESQTMVDIKEVASSRIIPYFQKIASAGSGEYLFDYIPTDTIKVPLDHISQEADFVVGVNGDSMEPNYHDGDKVLVKKTTEKLQKDQVGIFMIGNDVLIKRVGDEGLLSDNKNYPGIPYTGTQDIKCIGEVVGKTVPGHEKNLSDTDLQALSFKAKMFNENPKISSFPFGNR
nr:MAG TPA: Repressor protein CI [Caudoviricetes sp.]